MEKKQNKPHAATSKNSLRDMLLVANMSYSEMLAIRASRRTHAYPGALVEVTSVKRKRDDRAKRFS
jgi:hypothetical protein